MGNDKAKMKESVKYIELAQKNEEIMKKYKSLKNVQNKVLDALKYKMWTSQDVLHWIFCLDDGYFMQYDNLLALKFKEQQFDGSCLDDVDFEELEMWNIKNQSDIKCLLQHIQMLKK